MRLFVKPFEKQLNRILENRQKGWQDLQDAEREMADAKKDEETIKEIVSEVFGTLGDAEPEAEVVNVYKEKQNKAQNAADMGRKLLGTEKLEEIGNRVIYYSVTVGDVHELKAMREQKANKVRADIDMMLIGAYAKLIIEGKKSDIEKNVEEMQQIYQDLSKRVPKKGEYMRAATAQVIDSLHYASEETGTSEFRKCAEQLTDKFKDDNPKDKTLRSNESYALERELKEVFAGNRSVPSMIQTLRRVKEQPKSALKQRDVLKQIMSYASRVETLTDLTPYEEMLFELAETAQINMKREYTYYQKVYKENLPRREELDKQRAQEEAQARLIREKEARSKRREKFFLEKRHEKYLPEKYKMLSVQFFIKRFKPSLDSYVIETYDDTGQICSMEQYEEIFSQAITNIVERRTDVKWPGIAWGRYFVLEIYETQMARYIDEHLIQIPEYAIDKSLDEVKALYKKRISRNEIAVWIMKIMEEEGTNRGLTESELKQAYEMIEEMVLHYDILNERHYVLGTDKKACEEEKARKKPLPKIVWLVIILVVYYVFYVLEYVVLKLI